ncbi:RDD family protein [Demequina iriomotensis]|uniref:RDD family protein n=1 Tax=Demequina iriomotensis TaxID=1536641 RepID=UPI000780C268|nr:RDD family protein [Demequina iriomotensis]
MTAQPAPETPSAHVPRRLGGIAIDWALCLLISSAFFPDPSYVAAGATAVERAFLAGAPFATLAIWALQHLVLVATLGSTIGHRLTGLRVVREDGAPAVGPTKAAIRTGLLALVIPAVVWGPDGRGLHDRLATTRIVRLGTAEER